jgi:hypothetical protein
MLHQRGQIAIVLMTLIAAAGTVRAQQPVAPQRKIQQYALLIGVDEYGPPLNKLDYCYNDISELKPHLEAAGFSAENITTMHDRAAEQRLRPTKANIEGERRLRLAMANENDIVVVAFSGHGLQLDGKSYLCPVDAKLDSVSTLVSIDDIYEILENCQAGQKLLLVDACRNEPLVRGFKSARIDDLEMQVQSPPRGVLVLSSCEAGQFSAEDTKLRHGVFMYYIMQGLSGLADTDAEIGGNNNGVISLDELYFFSHEKTKRHVASSHGILQRPVMKGEMVGRFDLAKVPNAKAIHDLQIRETSSSIANAAPVTGAGAARSVTDEVPPLLLTANTYFSQGDYENAIRAYTSLIENGAIDAAVRLDVQKRRGAAYLARLGRSDIDNALIDQQSAGLRGIEMTIHAANADLKVGTATVGKVTKNQIVLVTMVKGDWLWVASVNGTDGFQGYINKSAVMAQPVPQTKASTTASTRPAAPAATSQSTYQPYKSGQTQTSRPSNNGYNNNNRPTSSRARSSRPPSIWETPEWETPAEIRRGRANGTLR